MKNYFPYIVGYSDGSSISPDGEKFYFDWLVGEIELFFIPGLGVVFRCLESYRDEFSANDTFFDGKRKIYDLPDNAVPATRKEIQAAGLWDMVVNKDNYSSKEDEIETKLDEYQRIGEEVIEERKKS